MPKLSCSAHVHHNRFTGFCKGHDAECNGTAHVAEALPRAVVAMDAASLEKVVPEVPVLCSLVIGAALVALR